MTLENISNIDGLFAVINQCTGNVELISDEGPEDRRRQSHIF